MRKNIVLLADGTGNSASKLFKTNVWRLYEALDLNEQVQVASFSDGVGTSSFKPFEVIGLALGFGVKRRVIGLYKFLCLNYQPGDRIFVFGFSRGAFTIRLLVGLVAREGLVDFQSHEELNRNALAAYRAFREKAFPSRLPWTLYGRRLRDASIRGWNWLTGSRSYDDVRPRTGPRSPEKMKIAFVGVWDTVAAYGLPIDELTKAVNRWIWPMTFEKPHLLPCVERARQALSLDDERRTFFPIPWSSTDTDGNEIGPDRLCQVWFAGVHSNIGGGYPDDRLAHVPLCWMIEEAQDAGLKFKPDTVSRYTDFASENGRIYDSRANLGFFYRYHPRDSKTLLGHFVPLVDWSVLLRMADGPDGYAPVSLPSDFRVRLPDGTVVPFLTSQALDPSSRVSTPLQARAETALTELRQRQLGGQEDQLERFAVMHDTIWWRRAVYYALLFLVLVAAFYPLFGEYLTSGPLDRLDEGAGPIVGRLTGIIEFFTPGFAMPWLNAVARNPASAAILAAFLLGTMWFSAFLRTRIADRARIAWCSGRWRRDQTLFAQERAESHKRLAASGALISLIAAAAALITGTLPAAAFFAVTTLLCFLGMFGVTSRRRRFTSSPFLRFARFVRTNPKLVAIYNSLREHIFPALSLTATGLAALFLINKAFFDVASAAGAFCAQDNPPGERAEVIGAAPDSFDPTSICWDTHLILLKGERYRITLDIPPGSSLKDDSLRSGAAGMKISSIAQAAGVPLRRWWGQPYFQLVARIGSHGSDEQAVTPIRLPDEAPENISRAAFLFTPRETGRLYLYLNDAALGIPGLYDLFYRNNRGAAQVIVENVSGY
ncbi:MULTISPECIES: DUF2235 domain-containing protein [unclassified Sinorhizobium]|uniref:DUF2235 domain-containing protein n=1 Tax=unclassified Sinorhizobium TaxID=2613772 RepID=UPI0024C3CA2F|nr:MULTISPECIES: DUF2235 domain-containing protein [unclassified Sinorhizobium]MDK1376437.1 DUF2235 domain-containing protein [Sinorhizobium sp. 6-70]MDK1479986.1 DUF2235 domain-containing protein [Sinorhizobium sp. 6-117]